VGVADHSGWAVFVTVGGASSQPEVVDRRRVTLVAPELPRQPYHAAVGLPLHDAERLIRRVESSAARYARRALDQLVVDLGAGTKLRAIAIRAGGRSLPSTTAEILAAHAIIHAAEGALYRDALTQAAADVGVRVYEYPRHLSVNDAAPRLGTTGDRLAAHLTELGRKLGPPWQKDHRTAAVAAAEALVG